MSEIRLIDANAYIDEINERIKAAYKWYCNSLDDCDNDARLIAEQAVATFCEASLTAKKMPTIDAVEVVRCKDCKWWDKREESNYGYCHAAKHGYYSSNWEISIYRTYREDFFCADGERMDGKGDDSD